MMRSAGAATVVALLRPDDEAGQRHGEAMRVAEALLFASAGPVNASDLATRLPAGSDVDTILRDVARLYAARGVNLVEVAGGWAFRTAPDLAASFERHEGDSPALSRSAMEVLAIIAYHQPATQADIEEIRGLTTSKGILDVLMATGWVRLGERRRTPGRPLTFGTTPAFLDHFGLKSLTDLPDAGDLRDLGLLDEGFGGVLVPSAEGPLPLHEDEDPADPDEHT